MQKMDGITKEEYDKVYAEYEYFSDLVANLLGDAELGCKFKRTEEIFLDIMRIFLFNLEKDNREIIDNFTKAIDSEDFIKSHEMAIKKEKKDQIRNMQKSLKNMKLK